MENKFLPQKSIPKIETIIVLGLWIITFWAYTAASLQQFLKLCKKTYEESFL